MASTEPTEAEIGQLCEFASLHPVDDRQLAINALKNLQRDVSVATGHYYDDPDAFRAKYSGGWNDDMFSGDRDNAPNNTGISFHVESPTQNDVINGVPYNANGSASVAPSRPPSRTSNRSPLSNATDWMAPGINTGNQTSQEDENYRRALEMSAREAGVEMPPQESGVVNSGTSQSHFGPANRDNYESEAWAMVPTGQQQTIIDRAPPASTRKRNPGAPAFLAQGRSSQGPHQLGALLTILHEIPLVRNVFLDLGEPAATYGHNSEWWNGQEILPEHVLAKLQSGEMKWGEHYEAAPRLEDELHRAMAFLDSTERAYGTVSVLTDMLPMSNYGAEKQFYETIANRNNEKLTRLYLEAVLSEVKDEDTEPSEVVNFGLLELEHHQDDYQTIKTLYECLDHVMWNDALNWDEISDTTKMAMFQSLGEAVVLKISGNGPPDSMEIPLELCLEKYTVQRKPEARRMQAAWVETKLEQAHLRQVQQTLIEWEDQATARGTKAKAGEDAKSQWQGYRDYLEGLGKFRTMEASGFDTDKYPDFRAAESQHSHEETMHQSQVDELLAYSERLKEDVEAKLQWVNKRHELLEKRQRFIGKLLTDTKKERPQPMTSKKYQLRGVATSVDVVYVCQRSEPDLIDLTDEPKPLEQWWRLSRDPEGVPESVKVEVERVLRDMWQETKKPIMVYATEEAMTEAKTPLPGPLARFVKADNKAFRQELNQEQAQAEQPQQPAEVMSPSKRKHRSDSMDSLASNRASAGSREMSERGDHPFDDEPQFVADPYAGETTIERQSTQSMETPPDYTPQAQVHKDSTTNEVEMTTSFTSAQMSESSRTITPDNDEARSPEMQEKSRPPAFMTKPSDGEEQARGVSTMEMEVPEHQA